MDRKERAEIVAMLQRTLKNEDHRELYEHSLDELQRFDAVIGDRDLNAPWRNLLRDRIKFRQDENKGVRTAQAQLTGSPDPQQATGFAERRQTYWLRTRLHKGDTNR